MKISTKGRYALRLMIDLAEHNDGTYIALKDISARQEISVKYLEQIVSQISKSGFLKSSRGPQGGYCLMKQPSEYTVGAILRAIEGNLAPVACLVQTPNECRRYKECKTLPFWEGLYETITDYVDSVTLDTFLRDSIKK